MMMRCSHVGAHTVRLGNSLGLPANVRNFSSFPPIIKKVGRLTGSCLAGGCVAALAGCSTVYAAVNGIRTLPFSTTAPTASDRAGSGFRAQLKNGSAELHPTGKIVFTFTIAVDLYDRSSLVSAWSVPVKITLRLYNVSGHLLESFEIYSKTGQDTKDFPVSKEILQQTTRIGALMILLD